MLLAKRPSLFIVGQPRSGTSALYEFLKAHPDVFMSEIKEPEYFSKDFKSFHLGEGKIPRTDEGYLTLFNGWRGERVVGEASTKYLYSKVAANEIYHFNPSAKIIMMIREPVEFLLSYHSFRLRSYFEQETIRDFVQALDAEPERKLGKNIPKKCLNPSVFYYSERVKYAEQIARYYDVFDKTQIAIIVYDDFKRDNATVYRETLRFLEIDSNFIPEFRTVNPNATVRSKVLKSLMDTDHVMIRKLAKSIIPKKVFPRLSRFYSRALLNVHERPPLDPSVRARLKERYKTEVEAVSRLLNKDLVTLWGYQ